MLMGNPYWPLPPEALLLHQSILDSYWVPHSLFLNPDALTAPPHLSLYHELHSGPPPGSLRGLLQTMCPPGLMTHISDHLSSYRVWGGFELVSNLPAPLVCSLIRSISGDTLRDQTLRESEGKRWQRDRQQMT